MFDPVALNCGHIFCYMCACNAASVTIVDGLQAASLKEKCALCREVMINFLSISLCVVSSSLYLIIQDTHKFLSFCMYDLV